jgi:uncharacterized membrane protein YphA (DoxX/SURF4 family)
MNTVIWIVQGLLAVMYALAGVMKTTQPKEKLQENMGWVNDFSQNQVRLIGTAELLAAAGLILPMALDILEVLTPLAATGLVILMLGAMYTHYRRKEYPLIAMTGVLMLLALFVAYGRFIAEPVV